MEKVKVAIRVRPINKREIDLKTQNVINVESNKITINNPHNLKEGRKAAKTFAFDYCFDSSSTDRPNYATQEIVYNSLGLDIINNAFSGYNACIFAYGQTGSGKSYTMTGGIDNKGLIPRICEGLFDNITQLSADAGSSQVKIEVSFMEIYNEKVLDLLDPRGAKTNLKVREHKLLGPYVDGLSQLAVSCYKDIEVLINEGNKSRTVAATSMNSESSRSHAVFCLKISQTITDTLTGISGEKVSKLSLVDLAGSEKASKTGVEGERLKEGCNINRSLLTLGSIISALADNAVNNSKSTTQNNSQKAKHIPYRDSVLTWLLKDSLGGNSKTVMIATISPAFDNYEETMSTLRYADRAKRIENHAFVNEDPNAKLIRELREEVEALKQQLVQAKANNELIEKLNETEKIYKEVSKPWDEKLAETEQVQREWSNTLEKLGISVQSSGIKVEKDKFYLVNMSADPSMNELLVYYLKDSTVVGKMNNPNTVSHLDIQLSGPGIAEEHCVFQIRENDVYVRPLNENASTRVNGTLISEETLLYHSDRIVIGFNHFFRINCSNKRQDADGVAAVVEDFDYDDAQHEVLINDNENAYFDEFDMQNNDGGENRNQMKKFVSLSEEKAFKTALNKLQEQLIRANTLAREANVLSKEMSKQTTFGVTLQISPSNLKLIRNKDTLLFEAAILVKRSDKNLQQTWSLEKFENRIIDMREMYRELQNRDPLTHGASTSHQSDENDPFYEALENHKLIGVANLSLNSLFEDCKFVYTLPIINQQGDIAGYLKVELTKDKHYLNDSTMNGSCGDDLQSSNDTNSENSDDLDRSQMEAKKIVKCILTLKEAIGLPASLSNFVFCQYKFWNELDERCVVPEADDENFKLNKLSLNSKLSFLNGITIRFNHSEEHVIRITEDFVEHCIDGSLPIEVWGHHNVVDDNQSPLSQDLFLSKYANLIESWQQVRKSLKIWIEILELDKNGQWNPVSIKQNKRNHTGGVYQLKQGQSKRLRVRIDDKSLYRDLLPLYIEDVASIEVGCVQHVSSVQLNDTSSFDSYQEEDLVTIRRKWLQFLEQRKAHIDAQYKQLMEKQEKNGLDIEREKYLYDQLVELTEERNLVEAPPTNSHLPGSQLNWKPESGMEDNIPIVFLNSTEINNDSTSYTSDDDYENSKKTIGNNCLLANEDPENEYIILPMLNNLTSASNLEAIAIWDSTIHEENALNLVTPSDTFVYLICKIRLKVVQPIETEIYVRKRLCVQIYDPNHVSLGNVRSKVTSSIGSFFGKMTANLTGSQTNLFSAPETPTVTSTGVTYYIISNIPRCLEDFEQYDNLAMMAAINSANNATGTNLIEKYLDRYMSCIKTVDNLLKNDKRQQELALKQAIQNEKTQKLDSGSKSSLLRLSNKNLSQSNLKKTTSVPNFKNALKFGSTQNISKMSESTSSYNTRLLASTPQNGNRAPVIMSPQEPVIRSGGPNRLQNKIQQPNNLVNRFAKPQLNINKSLLDSAVTSQQHQPPPPVVVNKVEEIAAVRKEEPVRIIEDEPVETAEATEETTEVASTATAAPVIRIEEAPVVIANLKPFASLNDSLSQSQVSLAKSETSLTSSDQERLPEWVKENARVIVSTDSIQNQLGTIRFVGDTKFRKGTWIGVELERQRGKNDGSYQGVRYFKCENDHGVFVRWDKLTPFKN